MWVYYFKHISEPSITCKLQKCFNKKNLSLTIDISNNKNELKFKGYQLYYEFKPVT